MLTIMREHRRSLQIGLIVVVVAFIASLFVFGATGSRDDRVDTVARVNGEPIPVERYHRRYQTYVEAYSRMYRERFTSALAEQLGLGQQVINDLVQEAVVVQAARAEGFDVSDAELNVRIHAIPAFHEDGRFALKRYQDLLRRRGMSPGQFEEDVRRELTRIKIEAAVRGGVRVTDAELEQAWVLRREEVRVAWALVDLPPLVAAATAGDAEIRDWYAKHQAELRLPERRKIQYVTLVPKDFTRPPPETEVEKYYAEHAREFEAPRQRHALHVLVRVPETGGSEAEDRARAKAADVIRRAGAGEDFGKLAREVSEDPGSKAKGGDLGWVSKGELVPQFEEAAFRLGRGEVTREPVRTPFGFHAIKVLDVREGGKKPLRDVAAQIRERLASQAAEQVARAKADEAKPALAAAKDFAAEARRLGLTPAEATVAKIDRPILGVTDPLEEAAFAAAVGGVAAPVKTPAGWVVLKMVAALPAGVPPLDEARERIVEAVKRAKADAAALARARQIAADAAGGDLGAAARKAGATAGETQRFSRSKPADRLPGDVQLAALQTPAGAVAAPVKTPQGYYVVRTLERVPPSPADLAAERERLAREVLAQKQGQAWESWVTAARAGAKVEILQQPGPRRG